MNMFKPTKAKTPVEYIKFLDEPRKSEIKMLHDFIQKTVPKLNPFIQSGMIGYGKYHYKYASGREGDWAIVALASQKNYISVYFCAVVDGKYVAESYKKKFPKASIGKSCIRFKKLEDIDMEVLKEILIKAEKSPNSAYLRNLFWVFSYEFFCNSAVRLKLTDYEIIVIITMNNSFFQKL